MRDQARFQWVEFRNRLNLTPVTVPYFVRLDLGGWALNKQDTIETLLLPSVFIVVVWHRAINLKS